MARTCRESGMVWSRVRGFSGRAVRLLHQQEPGPWRASGETAPGMMWLALQRPKSWGADLVQILMRAQSAFLLATPRFGGDRPGKKRRYDAESCRRRPGPRRESTLHPQTPPCTRSTRCTGCTGSTGRDSRELPIGCCLSNGPASGWSINPTPSLLGPRTISTHLPHRTAFSMPSSHSQNKAEDVISHSTSPFSLWPNGAILSTAATAVDARGQRGSVIHGLLYL